MWTCPACGERIQPQFKSCWKCAGGAHGTLPQGPPRTISIYGRPVTWTLLGALALLAVMILDQFHQAQGSLSSLGGFGQIWLVFLVGSAVGVGTGRRGIQRFVAPALIAAGGMKVALLFIATTSARGPGLAHEVVSTVVLWGTAALLWLHLSRSRK